MNKIIPIVIMLVVAVSTFGCTSESDSISYSFSGNKDRHWSFGEEFILEPVTLAENVPYIEIFENEENEAIARFIADGETIEIPYSNISIIQDTQVENPIAVRDYEDSWTICVPNGKILDLR